MLFKILVGLFILAALGLFGGMIYLTHALLKEFEDPYGD